MANKYWVGGGSSTNWDATGNTNWSDTDGGSNNATVPATTDDVFFKSAANCVINLQVYVNSLDCNGYTGTISGGASALFIKPAAGTTGIFRAGGTWSVSADCIKFAPVSNASIDFYSNGKTISPSGYVGYTGTVNQRDNTTFNLFYGGYQTYNSNGFSLTVAGSGTIVYANSGAFNITNSTVNISSSAKWEVRTEITFTGTGSTINFSSTGTFKGGGKTYNVVTFTGDGTIVSDNNTFATLNVNTDGLSTGLLFAAGSTQTITTEFQALGTAGNIVKFGSATASSTATIKKAYAGDSWKVGANSTLTRTSGLTVAASPEGNIDYCTITDITGSFALVSSITDDFDNNSLDTTKWDTSTCVNTGSVAETNQRLELTTVSSGDYAICRTAGLHSLVGDTGTIKIASVTANSFQFNIVTSDATEYQYAFVIEDGNIFVIMYDATHSWTQNASTPYVADTHRYLRIREASGTIYFDYASNGYSWVNLFSHADGIGASSIRVRFIQVSYGVATTSSVNDYNLLPASSSSSSSSSSSKSSSSSSSCRSSSSSSSSSSRSSSSSSCRSSSSSSSSSSKSSSSSSSRSSSSSSCRSSSSSSSSSSRSSSSSSCRSSSSSSSSRSSSSSSCRSSSSSSSRSSSSSSSSLSSSSSSSSLSMDSKRYSHGSYATLPTTSNDLSSMFTIAEYNQVILEEGNYVAQGAAGTNDAIFEFKNDDLVGTSSQVTVTWKGKSDVSCSNSPVYLEVYNRTTTTWVSVDSDNTSPANSNFTLTGIITSLSDYRDVNGFVACRVWQNAISSSSSSSSKSSSSSSSSSRSSSSSSSRSSSSSSSSCRSSSSSSSSSSTSSSSSSCRSSSSSSSMSSSSSSSRSSSSSSSSSNSVSSSSSSCRSSSSSSSASPACFIAAELFGGFFTIKTNASRYYIHHIGPKWFETFYESHSREIAKYIHNKPLIKAFIRPLFEYFALRAKRSKAYQKIKGKNVYY